MPHTPGQGTWSQTLALETGVLWLWMELFLRIVLGDSWRDMGKVGGSAFLDPTGVYGTSTIG